ncbi:hypothetical protein UZ36_01455 [Candidatus Nitromaritima sp. SCGC AAA799-C22]|nr:hypothetical protein UZ36_01455 [Candidatus Nitromaritima sp. SCGC AAA799-C22]
MRKVLIPALILVGCYVLWPYLAVFNLFVALKTGDAIGVEERIDWVPFKKDLQSDLDRLVEIKLKQALKKKGVKVSFDSLTLSKEITGKIATPKGLIYLFQKPDEFLGQIREIFQSDVPPEKVNPPTPQKKSYEPEAPNIPSLYEQIEYVFFTDPANFRLSFKKGDLPFTLDWRRQGLFWKLTRLKLPVEKI